MQRGCAILHVTCTVSLHLAPGSYGQLEDIWLSFIIQCPRFQQHENKDWRSVNESNCVSQADPNRRPVRL